jgi:hypothetical protein
MTITRRSWEFANASRKAKDGRKLYPVQIPQDPKKAAWAAKMAARQRIGGSVGTVGASQARSASRRKAPITLPSVSILGD